MNIICLLVILFIYYYYSKYYDISYTYKFYFIIFIIFYLLLFYFVNYQPLFSYKIANNLRNVSTKPLHMLLPDYTHNYSPIKVELLNKQNFTCNKCKRDIDINDKYNIKLSYIYPIEVGGNNTNNLQIVCNNCYI